MESGTTILETIHGSRLYGLAHADSDQDIFRVVAARSGARQKVTGSEDATVMGLDTFLEYVYSGSHQSCEALFSPYALVHPYYMPMFSQIRVTGSAVFSKYRRTIKSFSYGDEKRRRHAVRLGFNLRDLRTYGRFNPVLTEDQRYKVIVLSQLYRGQSLFDIASNF